MVCDVDNKVRYTWQLVSQFVSWDFCRYMGEQNQIITSDIDVLTFLRNMLVQRTEKSVTDITKHEIAAKFMMEVKAVQDITRFSCIVSLSETVRKICPELDSSVVKLIHHLETFLNALDSSDECLKQDVIKLRIEESIHEFSKAVESLLPQPDLLKVIETGRNQHVHQNPAKKVIYNAFLFEKVLECLHYESVTSAEAKLIALSLHEDKVFEQVLQNAETEPETEADSEQYSLSVQSSQPNENLYSQEFAKNSQQARADAILPHLQPPGPMPCDFPAQGPCKPPDINLSKVHEDLSNGSRNVSHFEIHWNAPALEIDDSSPPDRVAHGNKTFERENPRGPNVEMDGGLQFDQSSGRESDSDPVENSLHTKINSRLNHNLEKRRKALSIAELTDPDTSDCEKLEQCRFLTPTLYKMDNPRQPTQRTQKFTYLSDSGSLDSSVFTTGFDSQQNDPNWSSKTTKKVNFAPNIFDRKGKKNIPSKSQTNSNKNVDKPIGTQTKAPTAKKSAPPAVTKSAPKSKRRAYFSISSDDAESDIEHPRILEKSSAKNSVSQKAHHSKKTAALLTDSDEDESNIHNFFNRRFAGETVFQKNKNLKKPSVLPDTDEGSDSDYSTNHVHARVTAAKNAFERPAKKLRVDKGIKLYDGANLSLSDFNIRKTTSNNNNAAIPSTSTAPTRKQSGKKTPQAQSSGRKHKCKQCTKSYKTLIALKRHVFLKHTSPRTPPSDVDDGSSESD